MRADFENILKKYGHDVYLQRVSLRDGQMIYSNALEKHTSRFTMGIHRNLPRAREEADEGVTNTTDRTYYFKYNVNPYEGDRIYDYSDRSEDNKEVWLINAAAGMRGMDGHITFWVVGVTRTYPN